MTAENRNDERQWHIDKKVPLPMLFAIGIQTIAFASWAGSTAARLDEVERKLTASAPQAERVIRLEEKAIRTEEKIGVVQQGINEIKAILAGRPR